MAPLQTVTYNYKYMYFTVVIVKRIKAGFKHYGTDLSFYCKYWHIIVRKSLTQLHSVFADNYFRNYMGSNCNVMDTILFGDVVFCKKNNVG